MLVLPDLSQPGQAGGLARAGGADQGGQRLRGGRDAQRRLALIVGQSVTVADGDAVEDLACAVEIGRGRGVVVRGRGDQALLSVELVVVA